jgi:hypothetical protein
MHVILIIIRTPTILEKAFLVLFPDITHFNFEHGFLTLLENVRMYYYHATVPRDSLLIFDVSKFILTSNENIPIEKEQSKNSEINYPEFIVQRL